MDFLDKILKSVGKFKTEFFKGNILNNDSHDLFDNSGGKLVVIQHPKPKPTVLLDLNYDLNFLLMQNIINIIIHNENDRNNNKEWNFITINWGIFKSDSMHEKLVKFYYLPHTQVEINKYNVICRNPKESMVNKINEKLKNGGNVVIFVVGEFGLSKNLFKVIKENNLKHIYTFSEVETNSYNFANVIIDREINATYKIDKIYNNWETYEDFKLIEKNYPNWFKK
jgi:hypothetical protein